METNQLHANLIDNALKYGIPDPDEPAPNTVAVSVTARRTATDVELVVADTGPGIPESDRQRVLDRFVRLEGARSRPGSGLGLSLVAAIARLHGGTLSIDDNAPGLVVTMRLPLVASLANEPVGRGVPARSGG